MGIPNRLIGLFWPNGSRRFCPEGVGDHSASYCRYCLTDKGTGCDFCPLLCEMRLHQDPYLDRAVIDVAAEGAKVQGRVQTDILLTLRRSRRHGTRNHLTWWPAARINPAFDPRILALVAVAVVPGLWVWPLRGHIKAATVSLFSFVRRTRSTSMSHRLMRRQVKDF